MNRLEHILTIIGEEAAEVVQAASKAKRFGLDDGYPNSETTNAQDLMKEYYELMAVISMLNKETYIMYSDEVAYDIIVDKQRRVEDYLLYSKERGTLNE